MSVLLTLDNDEYRLLASSASQFLCILQYVHSLDRSSYAGRTYLGLSCFEHTGGRRPRPPSVFKQEICVNNDGNQFRSERLFCAKTAERGLKKDDENNMALVTAPTAIVQAIPPLRKSLSCFYFRTIALHPMQEGRHSLGADGGNTYSPKRGIDR